jgi:hypothetical protein
VVTVIHYRILSVNIRYDCTEYKDRWSNIRPARNLLLNMSLPNYVTHVTHHAITVEPPVRSYSCVNDCC